MNILVTGGAGYVGSIVTEELIKKGHKVVVVDNLKQGHRAAVHPEAELVISDIGDKERMDRLFFRVNFDAVMHMAAETVVEYSMTDPKRYFHNNIIGSINLIDIMLRHHVNKLIFSSSAATYGEPQEVPITENHPKSPVNSYGESKLMFEKIINWYGKAYGLNHISFRYFNAAGASERFGEDHRPETHLIPNVLAAAPPDKAPVNIFGIDYSTRDGSCIRDYVHVVDIAQAHILALEKINDLSGQVFNLGSGEGYSVLEVIEAAGRIIGDTIPVKICPRRSGDPAVLTASSEKARQELGWQPKFTALEEILNSAWVWLKQHPQGYSDLPRLEPVDVSFSRVKIKVTA
ncbi:MAG: UDP-glucose 4-epimerase GalE [Dehalococcoidales bacterium]|nr:UDP-glucose 4-epimerase GalE [Dehalococcoidales bacterium]